MYPIMGSSARSVGAGSSATAARTVGSAAAAVRGDPLDAAFVGVRKYGWCVYCSVCHRVLVRRVLAYRMAPACQWYQSSSRACVVYLEQLDVYRSVDLLDHTVLLLYLWEQDFFYLIWPIQ